MTKITRDSTTMESSSAYPPEIHLRSDIEQNDDDTVITFEHVRDLFHNTLQKDNKQESWTEENGMKLLRPRRNLFTREVTVIPEKVVDQSFKKEGLLEKLWNALNLVPEDNEEEEKQTMNIHYSSPTSTPKKGKNTSSVTKTVLSSTKKKKLIWDPFLGELPAAPETMSVNDERVDYDSVSGTLRDASGNPLSFTETAPPKPALHLLFVHGSCSASSSFDNLLQAMHQQLTSTSHTTAGHKNKPQMSRQNSHNTYDKFSQHIYQDENRQEEEDQYHADNYQAERCPSACSEITELRRKTDLLRYLKGSPVQFHLYDSFGCGNSTHPSADRKAFSEEEITEDLQAMFASVSSSFNNGDTSPIFLIGHAHGCSQIIYLLNKLRINKQNSLPVDYERIKGAIFLSGALSDGPVEQISDNTCSGGQCIWQLPDFILDWLQPHLIVNDSFLDTALGPSAYNLKTAQDISLAKAYYSQCKWAASYEAHEIEVRHSK